MNDLIDPARTGIKMIALLVWLIAGCTKLISDEFPDFETVPTANCILIADEPITFHVSLAEKIDSTSLTLVENAVLTLSGSEGGSEAMTPIGDGLYTSEMIAMPGQSYSCNIQLDGFTDMYTKDTVPELTDVKITGQDWMKRASSWKGSNLSSGMILPQQISMKWFYTERNAGIPGIQVHSMKAVRSY